MARRVHRDVARLFFVGLVACALAGVVAYVGTSVQNGGALPLKRYTYVTGEFDDVGTLKVSQKVAQDGVRIGVVSEIEHEPGHAIVTLRLDGDHDVYRNATMTLGNESAVGRKYVILDAGTPDAGELGDRVVPTTQTSGGRDLNDVLAVFDRRTRKGVRTISQQLGGGTLGHGSDLNSTLQASEDLVQGLGVIMRTVNGPRADLGGLIHDIDSLTGRFVGRDRDLRQLLQESTVVLGAVATDDGTPLETTVERLPATLVQARTDLAEINPALADVAQTARTLRPAARDLTRATPALRGFLRESTRPLGRIPGVVEDAVPAVDELTTMFADARPVVPLATRLLVSADPLLQTLAPYAPDAGRTLSQHDMLSGHFSPTEHYFSAMLAFPGAYNVSVTDPLTSDVDPYPGPGNAFGPTYEGSLP